MAETLFLKDGTKELVFHNGREVLGRLIEDRLGTDAGRLFDELPDRESEDWQALAEESNAYGSLCRETLDTLNDALRLLSVPAPDLGFLRNILEDARENLYNEL